MKNVIILIIINILFFISANILAQERKYLLNTRGELIPALEVEKYVKPQYNDNLKRNIFGDVLFDPNDQIDTLSYRHLFPLSGSSNFGFFGQDVMIQWFVAPVDMIIKAAGVMCVENEIANTQVQLKLVKFAWTLDEISGIETPINLGYYPAVSGGSGYQITAYLDDPQRTHNWVDVTGNGLTSPFGNDLWSNNGVGYQFTPVVDVNAENYNWVQMNMIYEPVVQYGDIVGVSVNNLYTWTDYGRIGWYAAQNTSTGLPPTFKFYMNGRIDPGVDVGWWTREYTWDFVLAVVLTGDLPPSINSYTIIPSGIDNGPFIINANITDTNPSDTTSAGVAGVSIYFSIDSGMVWTEIPMYGSEPDFTVEIPASPPGSTVSYKILATDVNGNVSTSLITTFYIFPPSGANTLIVFNGLEGAIGYPQDYYFGPDVQNELSTFAHDTWSYGALQEELVELYDNIFEFCTGGPKDYNDSVITNWLAADGNRNYFLAGQQWLNGRYGYGTPPFYPGYFEYDILGLTDCYADISYDGTSGQELPTLLFPQSGTLFGQPLLELFNSLSPPADSMMYNPQFVINENNLQDGLEIIQGGEVEVDMMVETRGIIGVPMVDTLPTGIHRILPAGNKIVFLAYDPISVNTAQDSTYPYYYWIGLDTSNVTYQALRWFGIDIITGVEDHGNIPPKNFTLYQNYPNPFNPNTTIKYTIPNFTLSGVEGSRVVLKVYDVLGREVATLVNEEKPAGNYEAEFDGSQLASGIYFYQIKAGNFIETRKMLLLK